jgi:hypothetical protein
MVAIGTVSAERTKLPGFHGGLTDPAADWGPDAAIAQLNLEIVQRREIGLDGGAKGFGLRLGGIDIGLGRGALRGQLRIAPQIAFRACQLGLVAGESALRLRNLRFKRAAIEGNQQVALFDPSLK